MARGRVKVVERFWKSPWTGAGSQPRIKGSSYDLSATTNQVVVDWIVAHIMKLDMKFGEHLKQHGKEY